MERINREIAFVRQLEKDFSEVKFLWNTTRFSYRLKKGVPTVFLGQPCPNFALLTLHELGHALSKHKDYTLDVQRLKIESEAWERGKTVLFSYRNVGVEWDEEFVQDSLDSYRDWLHKKSRCKKCGLTRYQTEDGIYHCPRCEAFTL